MMLHIPAVLTAGEVLDFRRQLDAAEWSDGRATTGAQGAQVKRNQQLDPALPVAQALGRRILERLQGHAQFFSAALPLRILPPLFNRYAGADRKFKRPCLLGACLGRVRIVDLM